VRRFHLSHATACDADHNLDFLACTLHILVASARFTTTARGILALARRVSVKALCGRSERRNRVPLDREQQSAGTDQCDELTPLRIEHRGLSPLRAISAADRPGFSGTISLP
jgi:hypothetical protein